MDHNWNHIFNISDAQSAFTELQGVIDHLIEKCFPEQTVTMNYKNRHPWLTPKLKASIKKRNSMSNACKQNPDNMDLHNEYKSYRNRVTSKIRNAQLQYHSNEFDIVKNDVSKSWNVLRMIIGLGTTKRNSKTSFIINDDIVSDSDNIANAFNNYFVSIGAELSDSISSNVNPMSYVSYVENSMFMPDLKECEVRDVILQLKNTSAGWDNLPTSIGKKCVDGYLAPLTYILNMCIRQGVFPRELKLARVIPIYKSSSKQSISNYRPISILTFISKVFEKILYNHISQYMDRNDTICSNQFGFRKNHSTQQAIITLINKITSDVDSGDIAVNIFIDLKKAFDTVSHSILLKKLYAYGIRGNMLELCKSYLTDRSQFVMYNGAKSDLKSVKCGVPQGSVLGPLFFIAYMNDIFNASHLLYNILYADDTCIYLSGKDLHSLICTMNTEVNRIVVWLKSNKLTLNTSKTFYMVFHRGRRKLHGNFDLCIDNVKIKETLTMKYLGVIIDSKLNWISHITYVKNKVAKGIGIIRRARQCVSKKTLTNLYHTFIFPYLIYCVEVWGSACKTNLTPIMLLQKKVVRILSFSVRLEHTEPLFIRLDILPFNKLIHHRIGLFMYKVYKDMYPTVITNMYLHNKNIHSHNTRQKHHFHVAMGHSNLYATSFYCTSNLIWNDILKNIDISLSFNRFKCALKYYLQHNHLSLGYT